MTTTPFLVSTVEFAAYLGTTFDSVAETRALVVLDQAQTLCESVVSPLPAGASAVILDVATRAFTNPTSAVSEGVGPFSVARGPGGGGLYLTRQNKATLRRLNGGGGAFSVDLCPATAGLGLPWWDLGAGYDDCSPIPATTVVAPQPPIKVYGNFQTAPGQEVWCYPGAGQQIVGTVGPEPAGDKCVVVNLGAGTVQLLTAVPGGTFSGQASLVLQPRDSYTISSDGTAQFAIE